MAALPLAILLAFTAKLPAAQVQAPHAAGTGSAPFCTDSSGRSITCAMDVEYFGGRVIANVKVYAVFWGATVDSTTQSRIGDFYRALTDSKWMEWLTEYRTDIKVQQGTAQGAFGTGQIPGRGNFGGAFTITPSGSATCTGTTKTRPLFDSQITTELDAQISAGVLPPPDTNSIYMLYFPPGCVINDGAPGQVDPNGYSCIDFCAYHSTYLRNNQSVYYGIMPDFGSTGGCFRGCGPGTVFDNLCSASSHELGEAISDGEIGLVTGANVDVPAAWYDNANPSQGEIGDMCNQNQDTITSADGGTYTVQQLFSQKAFATSPDSSCITSRTEPNDFSLQLNPNSGSVDAGTSINVPVKTAITAGAPGQLTLTLLALPTGVSGSFDKTKPNPGDAVNLTLSAAASSTSVRDAVVVVRADSTNGAVAHSASLLLQLKGKAAVATNDFTLRLSPSSGGIAQGQSVSFAVTTTAVNTPETITFSALGLPAGVTPTFNPPSVLAGGSSTLTLAASATAVRGNSSFTLRGTSASVPAGHSLGVPLLVLQAPAVTLTSPTAGTVSGVIHLAANATLDTNDSIERLELLDGTAVLTHSTTSTVSFSWNTATVPDGAHAIAARVIDVYGASTTSPPVTVHVANGDFTIVAAPPTLQIIRGGAPVTANISTTAVGPVTQINLTATGLPANVSASFAPNPVAAGETSVMTLTSIADAQAGAMTIAVTGTAGAESHAASIDLTVTSPSGGCSTGGGASALLALLALVGLGHRRRRNAR